MGQCGSTAKADELATKEKRIEELLASEKALIAKYEATLKQLDGIDAKLKLTVIPRTALEMENLEKRLATV